MMKKTTTVFLLLIFLLNLLLLAGCTTGTTPVPPAPDQPEEDVAQTTDEAARPDAGPTATPTAEVEPLPPIILSSQPEPGAEQPLDAPLELTFDQPMDRDSVEKAFAIEPGASVDGDFEWVDDQTVRFKLDDGFERGRRYRVRVIESAQSEAGLAMQRPFELRFSAAGFLEVANVQPADGAAGVDPDAAVTVFFNRPVVPLEAIEAAGSRPDPLTFVPPVRGEGRWLNTSIYQFTPTGGFAPATAYTARVGQGLTGAFGQTELADDFAWSFTTVAPAVVASLPAAGDVYVSPTPVISLTFNQPMDRASVEENFTLVHDLTGETIPGRFTWREGGLTPPAAGEIDESIYGDAYDTPTAEDEDPQAVGVETMAFTPHPALKFGALYRFNLPAGTQGAVESTATTADFKAGFTVTPYPEIIDLFPQNGAEQVDPWTPLQITFNAPINPASLVIGENVIIEPRVAVTDVYTYWQSSQTQLEIRFPAEPSSRYAVTLGADIEGRYGHRLGTPATVTWETRAQPPLLFIHSPGRLATYSAYTDTLAFVTVRNINQVDFELYRLPAADFIRLNSTNWWEAWETYQPDAENLIAAWNLPTSPELNNNVIYRVDLGRQSDRGNRLPPGLYYLEAAYAPEAIYPQAQSDSLAGAKERRMLVVSHNNITLKSTGSEALAWVTDLAGGQPAAGTPLTFVIDEELKPAETGSDGTARVAYETAGDPFAARFVFAGDPDRPDENFAVAASNWTDGIERYQFDTVTVEDYQEPYTAHFYTDRPIYRPGQTVYFKGVIRADDDARYSLPTADRIVDILVTDSQGKEIFNDALPLSEMGTVNGRLALAENAALGLYTLQAAYADDVYFYDEFQVAAYRRPEFLVEATTDKPEYAPGEKVRVTASAQFFSGGPVSEAQVRWTLLSDDYFFRYTPAGGTGLRGTYDFTDYDFSRRNYDNYVTGFGERIAEGEGVTDAEGRFTFEVEADIAGKIASQRYTFDIVVTDVNNQEVAAQAGAIVHKGRFYIGLRPERYVGQVDQESAAEILVVDWAGEPVAGQAVQVVFAEHNWYSVQRQAENGGFYWDSVVEDVPVLTTTVTTGRNGLARAAFTPESGGVFKISAAGEDRAGAEVRSSTFTWVSGREYVNWRQENNDRINLVADKREYEVGDVATILVPHPYSGPVQALVTLERGHIYDHFVTELAGNSEQLEIPITEEMVPNMYVSVVVVQGAKSEPALRAGTGEETSGRPSFKVGYANLPVNTRHKALQITLTPDKSPQETYRPGQPVEYFVNVVDVEGQPVESELSLALVDKAVLSLAPEAPGQLMEKFWRNRGLGVRTGASLALAIDRINLAVAPEAKGGGGGFDRGFGDIRGEFKDTALWIADFTTDETGQGAVETTLPDNLTTWTMTARGVSGAETLVGEGTVEIVSAKPVLVRPVAPRFFVAGDEARMGMIIQNNSEEKLEVETRFEAEGLRVEPAGETTVHVAAGKRVKVEYDVAVDDVDRVEATLGARPIGQGPPGDAVTFDLPVYRFSTPETAATAGLLAEDGLRAEAIALPRRFDPTQGDLTVSIDPSLAAGMRDGLEYLEHFPYECTEQTVSRFLPNLFTFRAYTQLNLDTPELEERLPDLVSVGLQRLYSQQRVDGGWGWWLRDDSRPFLTAYVTLGLIEARRAGFSIDENALVAAVDYLESSLAAPADIVEPWQANRQAFLLYVLAEAGSGELGRSMTLFEQREQLDDFGRAFLALALQILDPEAPQLETLLADITAAAIVSGTGAHWEEVRIDYRAMNTDIRSTAIIVAALSRLQPDHPLLPQAVRWLMSVRRHDGHWETTQEAAWAIIGLTDWLVVSGELEGEYTWQVTLNGAALGDGAVDAANIDETTELRVEVGDLLAGAVNRLAVERDPISGVEASPGNLYYAAYLTYFKPAEEVKALDRGIIVSRQYSLAGSETGEQDEAPAETGRPITAAKVGDVIAVELTLIAPTDLHYVVVEDPFPAGAEGVDTSLATTSVVGEQPALTRIDSGGRTAWGGYGRRYFSHTELRDEKAVLFAAFLPKGTYEYTYQLRASLPGVFRVIPTHAEQMYFPEVFGRSDGALFTIEE